MRRIILTLGELEALASFGLTGLFAFYNARVAGHEAFCAKCGLVLGVDFHESAGDSKAKSFCLAFVATAIEIDLNVVFFSDIKSHEGLLNDILKDGRGEVNFQGALVDDDLTVTFFNDYARYGCFTAANCIN